ncbi:MAG TPA: hypothetical protein VNQ90_03250 [Chthoniobacteraceae bacterium]|nr:hypothetical protein [Chthoniobacteraceae bacterium]
MTIRPLFAAVLLSATVAFLTPSPAEARTWKEPDSGTFDGSDNQWDTVPGAGDSAIFTGYPASSEFTVTLTQDVTNAYIRLSGANAFELTLNLAGYRYTASTNDGAVARDANNSGNSLIITGGGAFNVGNFIVGRGTGSSGKLALEGGSTMETAGYLYVGSGGTGSFDITGGSKFNSTGEVSVGRSTAVSGKVLVSGSGSELTAAGQIYFASSNATGTVGELTVEAGGKVATTTEGTEGTITFAYSAGSTATVLITGEGSQVYSRSGLAIGGTRNGNAGGTADITVRDRGTLQAATTLQFYSGASLTVDGGTVLTRDFGTASNAAAGEILLTLGNTATSAASVRVSRDLFLDASTATLTLNLADGVSFGEDDVIHLIDYKGTLTGTFSNYSEGQLVTLGDNQFSFSYTLGEEGNRFIGLAAIPEPNSVAFLILGGLLAGAARLRGCEKSPSKAMEHLF